MNKGLPLWAEQLVVFDTETTGISPQSARIVTACLALLDAQGHVLERYDWMLNPGVEIPPQAAQVHGITTEMVVEQGMDAAHGITQIIDQLHALCARGHGLVVYNAPYDLTLLLHEAKRHSIPFPRQHFPVIDPLIIDRYVDRYRRGKRTLLAACDTYEVSLDQAHDAGADAIAAGHVMQQIATRYKHQLPDSLDDLHTSQVDWARAQAESFQEFMRQKKDPSFTADGRWPFQE